MSKNVLSSRMTQTARLFLHRQRVSSFTVSVQTILLWDLILQFTHLKYINSFFKKVSFLLWVQHLLLVYLLLVCGVFRKHLDKKLILQSCIFFLAFFSLVHHNPSSSPDELQVFGSRWWAKLNIANSAFPAFPRLLCKGPLQSTSTRWLSCPPLTMAPGT